MNKGVVVVENDVIAESSIQAPDEGNAHFVIEALAEKLFDLEDTIASLKTSLEHAMAGQKSAIAERDAYHDELLKLRESDTAVQAVYKRLCEKYDALDAEYAKTLEAHDVLATAAPVAAAKIYLKHLETLTSSTRTYLEDLCALTSSTKTYLSHLNMLNGETTDDAEDKTCQVKTQAAVPKDAGEDRRAAPSKYVGGSGKP